MSVRPPLLAGLLLLAGCTIDDPNVDPGEGNPAATAMFNGTYNGSVAMGDAPDPRCAAGTGPITLHVENGIVRLHHHHAKHEMTGPLTADGRFVLGGPNTSRLLAGTITGSTLLGTETVTSGRMNAQAGLTCSYTIHATRS